ncbi:hypothetical protein ACF09G_36200 [Streptomyces albogriseolus]|uniref:hypothetical protein n=1 Tax=Streptomyces albogriseolus TaxID=1887 RepID=UPI0019AD7865|nr:hypothetical protein [Streptomyces sp.]
MDDDQTVRAVVFDYKAVLRTMRSAHDGVAEVLRWLDAQDVSWVLLTNDPMDAAAVADAAGLPRPALHLCRNDIPGTPARGSGAWLDAVADSLKLRHNQLLLVGTSEWDWYTGINAGVIHVHARWASALRKKISSLTADGPAEVRELLEHFLLQEPTWAFRLDDRDRSLWIRSLLPPNVRFPADGGRSFLLQDIFTRARQVTVGDWDARDVLMLRLLTSAYLDDCLPGRSLFCVYPSSSPGKVSDQLAQFLTKAKVLVGSRYKENLLQRVHRAPDTSLERVKASRGQITTADISIAAQARTVRVDPGHRGKLRGKTVVVFDDFTTEGKSLEWARTLLVAAGAAEVIALTIGKYPKPHTAYALRRGRKVNPFDVNDLTESDFIATRGPYGVDDGPADSLQATMDQFITAGGAAAAAP